MKKILAFITLGALIVSCNKLDEHEFLINGTVDQTEDGKMVFLENQDFITMGIQTIDTAIVKDGKFSFKGKAENPRLHFIQVENISGKTVFILEKGEIKIDINKDSIQKSFIGGTFNNDELYKYNQQSSKISERIMKFRDENNDKMNQAMQVNDTVVINALRKEYMDIQEEMNTFSAQYAENNPKAYISVLIVENMINQPDFDAVLVKKIFENLATDLKESKQGENIKKFLDSYDQTAIGSIAPDFSAPNPEGDMVSLKESLGKVTIIDFWAAWCGPCRKENPHVVALYNEFHNKGLNIIGVSLDREGDAAAWKQAIEVDRLTWPQVSNLKHWKEPIAEMYGVKSIPATFILDAEGRIVAKDLRGDALRDQVASMLGE